MDGVDAALLETDGEHNVRPLESRFRAYTAKERSLIAAALGKWPEDEGLEAAKEVVEAAHLEVIGKFEAVDLVGFHGQTLTHDPAGGRTHQLGDGASIARHCGLPVAWDFRSADMKAGGQGAPLAPFYHHALVRSAGCTSPVAVLNLGGVGNVTVVDPRVETPEAEGALLAFDTGPANALVDDLMMAREGLSCDRDGRAAAAGQVDQRIVRAALGHPFFKEPPPKSLDRGAFDHVLGGSQRIGNAGCCCNADGTHRGVCRGRCCAPYKRPKAVVCHRGRSAEPCDDDRSGGRVERHCHPDRGNRI